MSTVPTPLPMRAMDTIAMPAQSTAVQPEEFQRGLIEGMERALLRELAVRPGAVADWRLTEVGCGAGGNLLELLRMGFSAPHLTGCEIQPERWVMAQARLPAASITAAPTSR